MALYAIIHTLRKLLFILILIPILSNTLLGQVIDTAFYSNGQIKAIKTLIDNTIKSAVAYKENGEIAYEWDIDKKTLSSYTAITIQDTLANYFKANCPVYTKRQHFGNGPLMEIENYNHKVRHGDYKSYDRTGNLTAEGQFTQWKKTGIWTYYNSSGEKDRHIHWFHHNYNDKGISIGYTFIPVLITLSLILLSFWISHRYFKLSQIMISFSILTLSIYLFLFIIGWVIPKESAKVVGATFRDYFFPVLTTLTVINVLITSILMMFKKLTGISRKVSIPFFAISLILVFTLLSIYVGSKISGAIIG